MSKVKSLHHFVFATKRRERTISPEHKKKLYAYIYGILSKRKCFLLKMNGVEDHIHMLVDVHPSISLSELMHDVKQASSVWLTSASEFPKFRGWAEGYYAYSLGVQDMESCKRYITNQEEHHNRDIDSTLDEELKLMSTANGLSWHTDELR